MIPLSLEARNFMAYEHLALDFSQFQIACLSGPNGSGKSSILDAMTWALFEKSRANFSEEVIRLGAQEVQVQFSFELEGQTYRILRSKQRSSGKSSGKAALEFQVKSDDGFRSLTGKSVTKTQLEIINTLHMDYGLFINSSFILQGRADVFTTSSAKERKEVLADILNLKQYDLLQDKAKAKRNQFLLDKQQIQGQITQIELQLSSELFLKDQHLSLKEEYQTLSETLSNQLRLQTELESEKQQLNQARLQLEHALNRQEQLSVELQKKESDRLSLSQEKSRIQKLIDQQDAITQGYQFLQSLIEKQDQLEMLYTDYLHQQEVLRADQNEWLKLQHVKEKELQQAKNNLQNLRKEEKQWLNLLAECETIEKDWQALQNCQAEAISLEEKARVYRELEKELWSQAQKMKAFKAEKTAECQRLKAQLSADRLSLEQLKPLTETIRGLESDMENLEQMQSELEQVTAKGQSCKHLSQSLAEKITALQEIQAEIGEKTRKMQNHAADHCPLCERLLSPDDVALLLNKYQLDLEKTHQEREALERESIENEALAANCRHAFVRLTRELKHKDGLLQKLAQARLEAAKLQDLQLILKEREAVLLSAECWQESQAWQTEQTIHDALKERIEKLEYSEALHLKLQTELRHRQAAAVRHHELVKAQEAMKRLLPQLNAAKAESEALEQAYLSQAFGWEIRKKISDLEDQLRPLAHLPETINQNKAELQRLRVYQQKWEALKAGQESWEQLLLQEQRLQDDLKHLQSEALSLTTQLAELPALNARQEALSAQLTPLLSALSVTQNRERELHAKLFSLEKELSVMSALKEELLTNQSQFQGLENEHRLYTELVEIFGQKGIQAVVIENALPEIEQAANDLLSQMTEGRMHLKFQTLKSLKSRDALSETLDIFISDELGTRSYETFSAGEAFRVNFAIRLAISRTLARRAGAKLQTLVIDEGFGSQDTQGKSRLVEAINAVSNLYACILVITHVDDLKSLFPTRIEVQKFPEGSRIQLLQ
ncbi:MAG: SMC family ATPase [Candidatus Sericytochromatia bacterium]|nr:SMC family ATPase [Candidatus Sericytochromatia bacterium]